MPFLAGSPVLALDTPDTVTDTETGSFQFTNSAYGVTSSSGTYVDCAVVFVANSIGKVTIRHNAQYRIASGTGSARCAPVIREGAVVGSGAVVVAAADERSVQVTNATTANRSGVAKTFSGLTPGASYNARLEHAVSGGATGELLRRDIEAAPAT